MQAQEVAIEHEVRVSDRSLDTIEMLERGVHDDGGDDVDGNRLLSAGRSVVAVDDRRQQRRVEVLEQERAGLQSGRVDLILQPHARDRVLARDRHPALRGVHVDRDPHPAGIGGDLHRRVDRLPRHRDGVTPLVGAVGAPREVRGHEDFLVQVETVGPLVRKSGEGRQLDGARRVGAERQEQQDRRSDAADGGM